MTRDPRRRVLRIEALGAAVMILAGSALHFLFDWTGRWPPAALIAAVNESVWEHLKLAFWPGLLWSLLVWRRTGIPAARYFAAKGIGLFLTAALIVAIFTGYTSVLNDNLLVLDIGTFVLAVILGQMAAAGLMLRAGGARGLVAAGLALLVLQVPAYALLSYFPPDLWLFTDSGTGLRGLDAR